MDSIKSCILFKVNCDISIIKFDDIDILLDDYELSAPIYKSCLILMMLY